MKEKSHMPRERTALLHMARECAARLKPYRKTIAGATDFFIKHLNRKKSTGRPERSGAFSGITPDMDWWDVQERMSATPYPKFNARIVYLLLMAHYRTRARRGADARPPTRRYNNPELEALLEQEAARQATMTPEEYAERIRKRDAEYKAYEREHYPRVPHYNAPAGKSADATADDIFKELDAAGEIRPTDDGKHYKVLDRRFATIADIKDAIRDIADQLKFAVKKQPRR